jgi:hypothetical protein
MSTKVRPKKPNNGLAQGAWSAATPAERRTVREWLTATPNRAGTIDDFLYALMPDLGIDPKLRNCWRRLSVVLWQELQRMQAGRQKAGRPSKYAAGCGDELVTLIDKYRRDNPRKTINHAIGYLKNLDRKKWGQDPDILKKRYYQFAKENRRHKREAVERPIVEEILRRLALRDSRE